MLLSEQVVDWFKHAFITKFNHIRPSVYERYMDVLCLDLANGSAIGRRSARKVRISCSSVEIRREKKLMSTLALLCGSISNCRTSTGLPCPPLGCPSRSHWFTVCWYRYLVLYFVPNIHSRDYTG